MSNKPSAASLVDSSVDNLVVKDKSAEVLDDCSLSIAVSNKSSAASLVDSSVDNLDVNEASAEALTDSSVDTSASK